VLVHEPTLQLESLLREQLHLLVLHPSVRRRLVALGVLLDVLDGLAGHVED
jgi:hypothetical protein